MPRRLGIRDPSGIKTISQPWPLLRVQKKKNLGGGKIGGEIGHFGAFKWLGDPLDMSIRSRAITGGGSSEL